LMKRNLVRKKRALSSTGKAQKRNHTCRTQKVCPKALVRIRQKKERGTLGTDKRAGNKIRKNEK